MPNQQKLTTFVIAACHTQSKDSIRVFRFGATNVPVKKNKKGGQLFNYWDHFEITNLNQTI